MPSISACPTATGTGPTSIPLSTSMGTERPAARNFTDDNDLDDNDASFCVEITVDPDDSTSIQYDTSKRDQEHDPAYQHLGINPLALAACKDKKWDNGRTLTVCFFGGSLTLQENVQNCASQWMQFANIKFRFVKGRSADIRIAFTGRGGRSDSHIGTDNLRVSESLPTMNLGLDNSSSPKKIQRTTLHEFGHALGLIHEHSQPNFKVKWNKHAVINDHRGIWDENIVEHNIFHKYEREHVLSTPFDQFSIMLYPIPKSWTDGIFSSEWNNNISKVDKAFIMAVYPFDEDSTQPTTPAPPPQLLSTPSPRLPSTPLPQHHSIPPTPVVVPPPMPKTYLLNTALIALTINKDVYTYAQTNKGVLVECHGQVDSTNEANLPDINSYTHQSNVVARYRGDHRLPGAPKMFTPLAAAYIGSTRASISHIRRRVQVGLTMKQYLFYVDDGNIVRCVKSSETPWPEETGVSGLGVCCAHSQLTAISFTKNIYQAICLYYQTPQMDGSIEVISYSTKTNKWFVGMPDMAPVYPPSPNAGSFAPSETTAVDRVATGRST